VIEESWFHGLGYDIKQAQAVRSMIDLTIALKGDRPMVKHAILNRFLWCSQLLTRS
jgi:hypothetical protein